MAQVKSLIDAECWLPSEFFNDTDFLMNKDKYPTIGTAEFCFGGNLEFPYEFQSFLSSPVHSVLGSTETESNDEEDFLVGFTRRLALSSFIETKKLGVPCFCKDQPEVRLPLFFMKFPFLFTRTMSTDFGILCRLSESRPSHLSQL